jgi:imidazolonepropionase-like amidohydrolase
MLTGNRALAALLTVLALFSAVSCRGPDVESFVRLRAPVVALVHVGVIDGTGAPIRKDQTVVIDSGRITALGPASSVRIPTGAHVLDLPGRTVMPGLVGMHEHLFYELGDWRWTYPSQAAFAMLYLAAGVTTIRTAGTFDLDGDLRIKRLIDSGRHPGPTIHVTSPYIYASRGEPDPARIARDVASWAAQGATSFKAYTSLRLEELHAAIEAAHARKLKITGHLCAVGFQDAATLAIDNLEHGLLVDTEFFSGKRPDSCPDSGAELGELASMDVAGAQIRQLISALVRRGVSITSTLAVFETLTSGAQLDPRATLVLAPRLQDDQQAQHARNTDPAAPVPRAWSQLLRKEMEFEQAFVAAGGRLLAGADPSGAIVAGFGDQRQLELLAEAGFIPEYAIKIATSNGAAWLNESNRIGTIAPRLDADLVVVHGNPVSNIGDVRNVEIVFKRGIAYDPAKLVAAAQGTVGRLDPAWLLRSPYAPILGCLILLLIGRRLWRRYQKD